MGEENSFAEGSKIAKISFVTLIGIGIAEMLIGYISNSIVTFADGVDSIGDSMISLIVWIGLIVTKRKPDTRFRFGYYKVENFAALLAAISMVSMGILITYQAIQHLIKPEEIIYQEISMITVAIAAAFSGYRAYQINKISKRYNLLSLKTAAKNSIKDSLASIISLFSLIIINQTGFVYIDSIGAFAIAAFIFSISYVAIKESSLILLDAIKDPKIAIQLKDFIEKQCNISVSDILLRPAGPYLYAEIKVVVKGNMTVEEFNQISKNIVKKTKKIFPTVHNLIIIPQSKEE